MGRMSIYLTNLGEYVEGCLIGQWVQLPIPQDHLQAILNSIGIGQACKEYFITDSETDILDLLEEMSLHSLTTGHPCL